MAKKGKGKAVNRRKSSAGGRKPLLALLLVVAAIVACLFMLERTRKPVSPAKEAETSVQTPHLKIPAHHAAHQNVTSATAAPAPREREAARPEPSAVRGKGPGKVAIIIDDMGTSMQELHSLLSINLPLTFSVIPSLAHAKGVAEGAHGAGAEVMVHMPMEPIGYPKQPMEKIGLLVNMDAPEIVERVDGYFRSVPFAVGANNHMGSRFTQDAEKMEVVLKVLKGKGVFFVDSRTSPASVGYRTAKSLGVKCAARQVFLDNVQDEAAIGKQLEQAADIARKKGNAIAICHPHPATIRTLQKLMPELRKNGITFVHVSTLTS